MARNCGIPNYNKTLDAERGISNRYLEFWLHTIEALLQ